MLPLVLYKISATIVSFQARYLVTYEITSTNLTSTCGVTADNTTQAIS